MQVRPEPSCWSLPQCSVSACDGTFCLPAADPPVTHSCRRVCFLAVVHIAMFGLQYWAAQARGSDWLASSAALTTHPASLMLLVAVFLLQVCAGGGFTEALVCRLQAVFGTALT